MAEQTIGGIAAALRLAFEALEQDNARFAFHCGEAGGMAAAAGVFGVKSLELCDDISDAYENSDWDFLGYILSELEDRPAARAEGPHARTREVGPSWDVSGAVLDDALRSLDGDDPLRYSLMIGFVSGLMFRDQGPTYGTADIMSGISQYSASDRPQSKGSVEERVAVAIGTGSAEITIRDCILRGHGADCRELIEWARQRVAAGVRLNDPMPFMPADKAARHYEERVRMMRWAQNLGLRSARVRDESVSVPNSMAINYGLLTGSADPDEDGEDTGP